ncbi:MAG: hypothetical protein HRT61_17420, partial [Ekhidna sp.]|nr:hypothetical protein [Ekhidna sp.]
SKDSSFSSVDYTDKTRIRIIASKPTCEIGVLPAMWVDTTEYLQTKNEIYRGIAEFDFKKKKVKKYLPFLNIARINAKDKATNGNLKAVSRLLKTIATDSKDPVHLKDSEIYAMVYSIPDSNLGVEQSKVLSLLPIVSKTLNQLATDSSQFNALLAPSGKDRVFGGRPEKQQEVKKLALLLSRLVKQLESDLDSIDKTMNSEIAYL